jgi:hypothetical protein
MKLNQLKSIVTVALLVRVSARICFSLILTGRGLRFPTHPGRPSRNLP